MSTDVLLNIASAARLFHTSDSVAFADLIIDGHRETWPVRSKRFGAWLRQQYYERTWDAPPASALSAALNVLEAQAQFDAPSRAVAVRVAEQDGLIYLDLADEFWRIVEIGRGGWRIADHVPVRFRRAAGMLALPLPVRGGSIAELRHYLNLTDEDDFVLVAAWLLGALRADGPYPVLAISGEQGSAKTMLAKLLRALVDPNVAPVRSLPREDRELFIAARNAHVLAFDNLSHLSPWLSDSLCRLASGGAFAVRQLYTDQDEILFSVARPVLLNGIEEVITRPDLGDRAIAITLNPIGERRRRPEQALWREFELARPRILGALLDAAVQGLRRLGGVTLQQTPRMADFALWASACETAHWEGGTFERAYWSNRRSAIDSVIEADPVAICVREIKARRSTWSGTASDFLLMSTEVLGRVMPEDSIASAGWPKNARALAGRMRRSQTFLRTLGIEITFSRDGRAGTRLIRITAGSHHSPPASVRSSVNA